MPKFTEKGITHIVALVLLAVGLIVALYLVQHPAIFNPKAQEGSPSPTPSSTPIQCSDGFNFTQCPSGYTCVFDQERCRNLPPGVTDCHMPGFCQPRVTPSPTPVATCNARIASISLADPCNEVRNGFRSMRYSCSTGEVPPQPAVCRSMEDWARIALRGCSSLCPAPTPSSNYAYPGEHCGGNIVNPKVCTSGYTCKIPLGQPPDTGGICVNTTPITPGGICGSPTDICTPGYSCQFTGCENVSPGYACDPYLTCRKPPVASPSPISTSVPLSYTCNLMNNRIQASFGTTCGDSGYDPVADVNKDRSVTITDFSLFRAISTDETACKQMNDNSDNPCYASP